MSEQSYNLDDPAFLISRSFDEPLSEEERRRLEKLLAESESLRSEADQLRAVDRLIMRWGGRPVELDWEPHAALVEASLDDVGDEPGLRKVDDLLERWGRQGEEVDPQRFAKAVMARIEASRPRSTGRSLIFRIGAPVAAAAAVALAFVGLYGPHGSGDRDHVLTLATSVVMIGGAGDKTTEATSVVSFHRLSDSGSTVAKPGISSVWASPQAGWSGDTPPL